MLIYGKNSVLEALKSEKTFNKLFIDKSSHDKGLQEIIDFARQNGVKVEFVERIVLENKLKELRDSSEVSTQNNTDEKEFKGTQPLSLRGVERRGNLVLNENNQKINYQGVIGEIVDFEYSELDDIFETADKKREQPFILILDGVEDPHNLGAIIRTAECAGVHGVIIPDRRACLVNETVIKTSAGAVANVNVVKVTNLNNTIRDLKDKGVWVYACEVGGKDLFKTNLDGSIALVVGSEGKGMSRLVKENCDDIVTIPMKGKINSLNVSVAAAISIFEVARNR